MTHTKGPWVANHRYVETKDKIICEVFGGNRKDALLIASAPDLLAALDNLARYADTCELFLKETHPGKADALRDRVTNARAAIAKATGEQS